MFDNIRRNFLYFLFFFHLSTVPHIDQFQHTCILLHRLGQPPGYLFYIPINDWTNLMMFYKIVIWIRVNYQSLMYTHNSNKYSKLYPHSIILSRLNLILILGILMETTSYSCHSYFLLFSNLSTYSKLKVYELAFGWPNHWL